MKKLLTAIGLFAMVAIGTTTAKADTPTLCLPSSFLSTTCGQSASYSLAQGSTQVINTNSTKAIVIQVLTGSLTATTDGPSSVINAVGTDFNGNNTQTFTPGIYYFILNGQTSFTITAGSASTYYLAGIDSLHFSTNNIATLSNSLSELDMYIKGLNQQINSSQLNYIPKSLLNVAEGVAGLNSDGSVTAPSDTTEVTLSAGLNILASAGNSYPNTTGSSAKQSAGYHLWYGNKSVLGTYLQGSDTTQVGDWWTTPPETLHLGGQSEGSSGYLNIHCAPYAGSNAGTCSQIMLGAPNIQGLAAGIGPGATGIASYDNFDVVNQTLQSSNAVPLYILTSSSASNVFPPISDGLDHTPTFTATGATFANPLPADVSNWLVNHQQGIRLMTNEVGCVGCAIPTYAGIVTGLTQNADGLVTGVTVGAWQVFGSGNTTGGQIPGQSMAISSASFTISEASASGSQTITVADGYGIFKGMTVSGTGIASGTTVTAVATNGYSQDTVLTLSSATTADIAINASVTVGSTPFLDTAWTQFGAPAIMVGVYTKDFNEYSICNIGGPTPTAARGDINYPSGGANNQLRVCEGWEMDLFNNDPVAHRGVLHGLTVAFNKTDAGGIPSYDSYDFSAAGANSIAYSENGEYWTLPFNGENFKVSSYNGLQYAAGSKKNIFQFSQSERIGFEADGGYPRNNIMSGMWSTRNLEAGCTDPDNTTCDDPNGSSKDITEHFGVQIDWYGAATTGKDRDALWNSPIQEQIEFNPASNHNGINLCYGTQDDTTCSLEVLSNGVKVNSTIFSTVLDTQAIILEQGGVPLTIETGSADSNNTSIQMFYTLSTNTVSFTNNHYGNTYSFNGNIQASGPVSANGLTTLAGSVPLTIETGSADSNNTSIQMTYSLATNTVSFTNNHYGNSYAFNGNIEASSYSENLSTPSSSTAACTAGQFTDDANYHYVCVATNSWKRAELSAF